MWNICTPTFPNEAILSAAFSVQVASSVQAPSDTASINVLRVVAGDELGNEFDPVGQDASVTGRDSVYYATEVRAFPRRGATVRLTLKQNGEKIAYFVFPNPAAHTYPQWKPSPLPVVTTTNGLSIALMDFKTQFEGQYGAGEKVPSTICAFKTDERGVVSTNWLARTA